MVLKRKLVAKAALLAILHLAGLAFFGRPLVTKIHGIGILWFLHQSLILSAHLLKLFHAFIITLL